MYSPLPPNLNVWLPLTQVKLAIVLVTLLALSRRPGGPICGSKIPPNPPAVEFESPLKLGNVPRVNAELQNPIPLQASYCGVTDGRPRYTLSYPAPKFSSKVGESVRS